LIAEKTFTLIHIFDQQSRFGGVWDYVPANNSHTTYSIPQTSPDAPLQTPIWREYAGRKRATYVSPVYDRLEANIPKMLMQHSTTPFPESVPLYASHDEIEEYLENYADPVKDLVQLETQVARVDPTTPTTDQPIRWTVHTQHLPTLTRKSEIYDAVLVATGHYNVPYIPDICNIAEFSSRFSASTGPHGSPSKCSITHSKAYSSPEAFCGLKTLVVGNGPSAVDIAAQIATCSAQPLLISTRSPPNPHAIVESARYVSEIVEFLLDESSGQPQRAVRLKDGTIIADLDAIIFCTGYIYAYPFLPFSRASASEQAPFNQLPLITTGSRVRNIYKHLFYSPVPSLAFLTLPWSIIPFPLAESQAALVSRAWSGKLSLPSLDEMLAWEAQVVAEKGDGKAFHKMGPPLDGDYINDLHDWCLRADTALAGVSSTTSPEDDDRPKPPYWDVFMRALRVALPKVKKAYVELGDKRREVRTLAELGFEFDAHKGELVDRRGEINGQ
jgi:cation diffusion facilitator CzcD-associated flavoprotein CzcO